MLKPGFLLPPLMFSHAEIEAIVLGSRWVAKRGDGALSAAAAKAPAKIKTVLPEDLRAEAEVAGLIVGPSEALVSGMDLGLVREAIRREHKFVIDYQDGAGKASLRTVWPFALPCFGRVHILAAWCELREDFRYIASTASQRSMFSQRAIRDGAQRCFAIGAWARALPLNERHYVPRRRVRAASCGPSKALALSQRCRACRDRHR